MADTLPVILDTDIGSDIDDAVALSYLLRQPRCELLGITTVTGDVAQRAACAEVLCRAAGRADIPIHCGASRPLLYGPGQPNVPQFAAIHSRAQRTDWPSNTAVEFLRQTIRSRPGEITLLTIGPYTNAALLFALDPEIPSLLKRLVSMAGVFYADPIYNEWNCKVDSVATAMVYAANAPDHLSVGLDVTLPCKLPTEAVRARFKPSPLDVALEMAEVWFQHTNAITFHDPLAAALLFHPELCAYETGQVNALVDPDHAKGGTTLFSASGSQDAPHTVAKTVDPNAFFETFFSVFL
ncbi:MAG TPA: nucleoside hydrolase [Chthonomonadaceae bacterium]|nr:nucleoside hydrolase [Chthonomonadaceae bacterium]